jgi:hypothetical protein
MRHRSDSSTTRASGARPETPSIDQTYRDLIRRGFDSVEAANLVAHLAGLRVGDGSWTLGEVNRLLFLRHLHGSGLDAPRSQRPATRAA